MKLSSVVNIIKAVLSETYHDVVVQKAGCGYLGALEMNGILILHSVRCLWRCVTGSGLIISDDEKNFFDPFICGIVTGLRHLDLI